MRKQTRIWYRCEADEDALCMPIYAWEFLHTRKRKIRNCHDIHPGGCMISLPAKPQIPLTGFPRADSWLFYGPPKIGKTEWSMLFPKPLLLELEEGGADKIAGHVLNIPAVGEKAPTLDQISDAFDLFQRSAFETLIIDTLDVINDLMEEEAIAHISRKMKKHYEVMGEAPEGTDWAESRKRVMGFIQAAKGLKKTVVFLAHSQATSGEKGTFEAKALTIDLPGKLKRRVPARIDNIGYMYGVKENHPVTKKLLVNRYVSFQPYMDLEAGTRNKELAGKILPMTDANGKPSIKAIIDCFKPMTPAK